MRTRRKDNVMKDKKYILKNNNNNEKDIHTGYTNKGNDTGSIQPSVWAPPPYLSRHYLRSCILKKKILKINMKGSKRRRRIKQNRKKVKMNKEGKTYSSGEDGNLVRGDVRSVKQCLLIHKRIFLL